ncbi:helix-turn-helix domain-containing protein [Flavobacterium sp. JP2137]|uniref:helix-turn-helix domain-containing protein n=1 Tax=Flavobacterium sp. JP2137 TaxID=3414510 RepID=UPI003D2FC2BE
MRKIYLLALGLFLITTVAFAQKSDLQTARFDSIYFDTAVRWGKQDYRKALRIADSLYTHSTLPAHKLKSLMLTASLYEQIGQQQESIKYALEAEEIASLLKDYEWQAKISGFLSTQYRNLGLLESGRKALDKGVAIIQKVGDQKRRDFYYGLVNQEMAYYEIGAKNYAQAKEYVQKSRVFFDRLKTSPNNYYYKATNEVLLASCEVNLGNYKRADQHLDQAIVYLDQSSLGESVLRARIFTGKAQVLRHKKDYESAAGYLTQAEAWALSSGFKSLQLEVYKELVEYYRETANAQQQQLYTEKYNKLLQSNINQNQTTLDGMITKMVENTEQLERRQSFYILTVGLLLLGGGGATVFYQWKKRQDLTRFNEVIDELKATKQLAAAAVVSDSTAQRGLPLAVKEKVSISKGLETKILIHLEAFEQGLDFLDKNISASSLATKVDTNTKYLSIILKNHRNKDFNNYIGGLRIQYIVDKMMHHPEYQQYKISYLAEECGFSTHSKFTAVFKKNIGITPSVFLEKLNAVAEEA